MEHSGFKDLKLSREMQKAIADMGFEEATPIQAQSIPIMLEGKDVIGQAQTGTGKTAAFGIAAIEKVDPKNLAVQAVILCPTRELAIQVSEELKKLSKYKRGIEILPVYGGQPIDRQIRALKKGVQIIIGTPGRVMDHMERRTLKLEGVKMMVLDEADEMLDMGFREDIELIMKKIPLERQTILFSATMSRAILDLTKRYQKKPQMIKLEHKEMTVPEVEQFYYEVKSQLKPEVLSRLIDVNDIKLSLVFCNTKRRVDELVDILKSRGYLADGLHGDLQQRQRDIVMSKFRRKEIEILVATDVAARGIDVGDIEAVFNYDIPADDENYVHRIGRTARAGKKGRAINFVTAREVYRIRQIQQFTKSRIIAQKIPSVSDIEEIKTNLLLEKVKGIIDAGHLGEYTNMIEKFTQEDYTSLEVASALLKMQMGDKGKEEPVKVESDMRSHKRDRYN